MKFTKKIVSFVAAFFAAFLFGGCAFFPYEESSQSKTFEYAEFEDVTYLYDGLEKVIQVSGLPRGATVSYSADNSQSEVGEYPITATITAEGYESLQLSATLKIVHSDTYYLQSEIDALVARLEKEAEAESTALEKKINDLKSANEKELKELSDQLETIETQHVAKVQALEELTATLATTDTAQTEKIAELQSAIQAAEAERDALKASIDQVEAASEDAVEALNAEIAELEETHGGKISALETLVATLNAAEVEQNAEIAALKSEIAALKEQMSQLLETEYHTVVFDSKGGSAVETQLVEHGEKAVRPADPKKSGYALEGWYVEDEKWSFIGYSVTDDITLTAVWVESAKVDSVSIHFPELGNKYTGDCTLIKVGENTEVLIDAGSRKGSAATLVPYIERYCTDGKLEFVIATHADQDHIAAFVGTTTAPGVLESFEIGTIIDFPLTNKTTVIYNDYKELRDSILDADTVHYTALECWNETNGAKRSYTLGEGVTMNILYQKFYEEKTSDENDYSVCMLLTQGENNYLFTGDLEKDGEASLVESNTLPKCQLFKGGHHGSPTSSTLTLLEVIQPEIVCVCCCCGSTEYTTNMDNVFPSQAFVDRVGLYTDQIYVTTMISEDGETAVSMNGNIVVSSDGEEVNVNCSNNNTVFKETTWFKQYRTWPAGGK